MDENKKQDIIVNESRLANSEICQKCAKCCRQFRWYVNKGFKDEALRLSWLNTELIEIKERKDYIQVIINKPCVMLEKKHGKYYCKKHGEIRPDACKIYPDNMLHIKEEWAFCPILKNVVKNTMIQDNTFFDSLISKSAEINPITACLALDKEVETKTLKSVTCCNCKHFYLNGGKCDPL